jgi:hypothetical protein
MIFHPFYLRQNKTFENVRSFPFPVNFLYSFKFCDQVLLYEFMEAAEDMAWTFESTERQRNLESTSVKSDREIRKTDKVIHRKGRPSRTTLQQRTQSGELETRQSGSILGQSL